jgi:hypothetical protein
MQQILEQLACDNGISIEDAANLFTAFTGVITDKLPQLKQLIDDVFENADADILEQHINRAVDLFQQREMEKYKSWIIPQYQTGFIKHTGGGELF